jgi:hypothetical protein
MSGKYNKDYDPISESKIFYPLSNKLLPFFHKLNFKPNDITILSFLFTLIGLYFYIKDKNILGITFFLIGFMFDCMDGQMARKYNQSSTYGMILDNVCDMIKIILLIPIIIYKLIKKNKIKKLLIILFLLLLFNFFFIKNSYLNYAILSYQKYNNDNFYFTKEIEIKNSNLENKIISKLYLNKLNSNYKIYRKNFPNKLNDNTIQHFEETIYKYKEFGPGNFIIFICILMMIT